MKFNINLLVQFYLKNSDSIVGGRDSQQSCRIVRKYLCYSAEVIYNAVHLRYKAQSCWKAAYSQGKSQKSLRQSQLNCFVAQRSNVSLVTTKDLKKKTALCSCTHALFKIALSFQTINNFPRTFSQNEENFLSSILFVCFL